MMVTSSKYERETKLAGLPIDIHQKNICKLLLSSLSGPQGGDQWKVFLDHGAGPFTNLGTRFNCNYDETPFSGVDALVLSVDPLAPHYNELLTKANIHNTLRTAYCSSETLSKCIGNNVVDFAIIINALDHSENPVAAFVESLKTVRIGGVSCVYSKEASRQNGIGFHGIGFHRWNFNFNKKGEWKVEQYKTKKEDRIVDQIVLPFAKRIEAEKIQNNGQAFICFQKMAEVTSIE
jgi:hypothetical protein